MLYGQFMLYISKFTELRLYSVQFTVRTHGLICTIFAWKFFLAPDDVDNNTHPKNRNLEAMHQSHVASSTMRIP